MIGSGEELRPHIQPNVTGPAILVETLKKVAPLHILNTTPVHISLDPNHYEGSYDKDHGITLHLNQDLVFSEIVDGLVDDQGADCDSYSYDIFHTLILHEHRHKIFQSLYKLALTQDELIFVMENSAQAREDNYGVYAEYLKHAYLEDRTGDINVRYEISRRFNQEFLNDVYKPEIGSELWERLALHRKQHGLEELIIDMLQMYEISSHSMELGDFMTRLKVNLAVDYWDHVMIELPEIEVFEVIEKELCEAGLCEEGITRCSQILLERIQALELP